MDRQVEGLIIASSQKNAKEIKELKKMNFPFVLVDRHYPDIETDYVIADNRGGIARAVDHLVTMGGANIGFVSIEPELDAIKERFNGYKETLEKHGFKYNPLLVQELNVDTYQKKMGEAINNLLSVNADAIVFSTHYLTTCGLRELRNKNIRVPDDVKIVSYDQFSAFDLLEPPITVVTQPIFEIGDSAVEILLRKLKTSEMTSTQRVLSTGFIIRKSCGE